VSERLPIAVLVSGSGTNLQAILDACQEPDFPARVALVVSNVPTAKALQRAEAAEVPTAILPHQEYPDRAAYDAALAARIKVQQALEHGVAVSGCTVHLVDAGMDTGPIVAQATVPVLSGDDEPALAARIQVQEHFLYPRVIRWFAEGRVRVEGRRVHIDGLGDGRGGP
jgi:phosphoribosylglycinamide formyltransferase-1